MVSGFCIHYPYGGGRPVKAFSFIVRRYVRVGLPLAAVIAWSYAASNEIHVVWRLLLWSLYCELVYYSVYPVLLGLARKFGWGLLLGASMVVCVGLIIMEPHTGMYAGINVWDPVLGFPAWLLGCLLAEDVGPASEHRAVPRVWSWRIGAWASSSLAYGLMLHTPIGFRWSLTLFAGFAYFWLRAEILYAAIHPPRPWLERWGKASYSLYLTHTLAGGLFIRYFIRFLPDGVSWQGFAIQLVLVFAVTAIFFFAVEAPAHALAKRLCKD